VHRVGHENFLNRKELMVTVCVCVCVSVVHALSEVVLIRNEMRSVCCVWRLQTEIDKLQVPVTVHH